MTYLISGATLPTGIRADLLVQDARITAVGSNLDTGPDVTRIDADGLVAQPFYNVV